MNAPKLLVIDDEAGFRDLLVYELGGRGYQVVTAANGEEAVAKAQGKDIDIVVSDLTMPKRGGIETLSALKAIDPKIEVIMVTGHATLESAVESMKRGAYDFITKPFQVDDIVRLIDRALEKRRLSCKVDELQEINRFKSEFLANMSHELRTPMNAILGYTSLHLDRVYGEVNAKQEESLKRVEAAGKNLLQLINSILDLSKVSAGRMPVYREDFSLKELGKEILAMMECLAGAKHLRLEWNMAEDIRIKSDKTKVKQILVNLATNGIKFTSTGGVFIEVKQAPEASQIQIRVRDTGIGIKTEDIPLLFQEFKQLDASSTREYGGTGLGLVISEKFAQLLGGAIQVESAVGAGTTFTVTLPLEHSAPGESATTILNTLAAGKNNRTLLAIDDDPEVLALLRDSLHGTGYAFAGALTGEEGIAMARELKPFAITLDIMMPHRDGWSVLQILKNDPVLRSIPVIMVSILDNKSLGFALGVTDYIIKPFERRELLEKLRAAEGNLRSPKPSQGEPPRTVCVVDDDAAVVGYLSETLRTEGYAVEAAVGGREALARLACGKPPNILFLDLMMPGVTGFDVLEAIDKDPRLKDILVIVLTAKHLTPQETDYLQKRVEMVIQKGSKSLAEILAAVKTRLEAWEVAR
jgi:CheY-like chemotaxis protein/nitrogen-specific signal transduction histidine kinase